MNNIITGIPMDYEPMRINRFMVEFPEEFKIPVWVWKYFYK